MHSIHLIQKLVDGYLWRVAALQAKEAKDAKTSTCIIDE